MENYTPRLTLSFIRVMCACRRGVSECHPFQWLDHMKSACHLCLVSDQPTPNITSVLDHAANKQWLNPASTFRCHARLEEFQVRTAA